MLLLSVSCLRNSRTVKGLSLVTVRMHSDNENNAYDVLRINVIEESKGFQRERMSLHLRRLVVNLHILGLYTLWNSRVADVK